MAIVGLVSLLITVFVVLRHHEHNYFRFHIEGIVGEPQNNEIVIIELGGDSHTEHKLQNQRPFTNW